MKNRILILIAVFLSFIFIVSCDEEKPVEPELTFTPGDVIILQ